MNAIIAEWRKMPRAHKPKRPAILMRMLGDIYQYPHPDYLSTSGNDEKLKSDVHSAFDGLVAAAARLSAVLPKSDSWYVLSPLIGDRLDHDRAEAGLRDLHALEEQIHLLAELRPRQNKSARGARIKAQAPYNRSSDLLVPSTHREGEAKKWLQR